MEIPAVQGSRFLARALPASDVDSVLLEQARLRSAHPRSCHVCFAYVGAREQDCRYSDDGEPAKTAGLPMLQQLRGRQLVNSAVLVTRYFGGVKLGTGGLVRAYAAATRALLSAARYATLVPHTTVQLQMSFGEEPQVRRLLGASGSAIVENHYGTRVTLVCEVPVQGVAALDAWVVRMSSP
ncbi:MAG: hypothetical protein RJA70_1753 [Pseudomonadota bacterium]